MNSILHETMMGELFTNNYQIEKYQNMSTNKKTVIIDVRTYSEFMGGNVVGSINIPLDQIQQRLDEIKSFAQPIILCCASGNRSGQATAFLRNQQVECENGGSWMDVNYNYQPN